MGSDLQIMPGRGREHCGRERERSWALMKSWWRPPLTFSEAWSGAVSLQSCPAGPEGAGGFPQLWAAPLSSGRLPSALGRSPQLWAGPLSSGQLSSALGSSPQLWAALLSSGQPSSALGSPPRGRQARPTCPSLLRGQRGGPTQCPPGPFPALSLAIGRHAVVLHDVIISNLAIWMVSHALLLQTMADFELISWSIYIYTHKRTARSRDKLYSAR